MGGEGGDGDGRGSLPRADRGIGGRKDKEVDTISQDMLVPIADLKASIELFHKEVTHFLDVFLPYGSILVPPGVHLSHLAVPLQAAGPARHAQLTHQ